MNAVEAKSPKARGSRYMNWARTRSRARFNLATSGLANLKLEELQVSLDELEITGEGEYGYPPLLNALAERHGVDVSSVVTAAGTSFANHLALAALINPGDEVLIESPAGSAHRQTTNEGQGLFSVNRWRQDAQERLA